MESLDGVSSLYTEHKDTKGKMAKPWLEFRALVHDAAEAESLSAISQSCPRLIVSWEKFLNEVRNVDRSARCPGYWPAAP